MSSISCWEMKCFVLLSKVFQAFKHSVSSIQTKCFNPMKHFVRQVETLCFGARNTLFHISEYPLPPYISIHEAIINRLGRYAVLAEHLADVRLILQIEKGLFAIITVVTASAIMIQ